MKKDEVDKILAYSCQDDWIVDDESGSFTYKEDLCLHIKWADFDTYENFNEQWATNHPDSTAKSIFYYVKYNDSFIDKKMFVSVDGHRATLPLTKSRTELLLKAEDVNFARIINIGDRLDEYILRSGLKVI